MNNASNIFSAWFRRIGVWASLVALVLVSCQKEEDNLSTGVTLYPALATHVENVIRTRGTLTVQDAASNAVYSDDFLSNGTVIRVYAAPHVNNTALHAAGSFRYSNGTWRSSVKVDPSGENEFSLFATTPTFLPGATDQAFNWGIYGENQFSLDSAALSFTDLDVLTLSDPIVSIAAAGQSSVNTGTPTLRKGYFSIGQVEAPSDNKSWKVWMAFDHFYSKATLSFAIDPEYHIIRDIRLKSAKIVVTDGRLAGTHTYMFTKGIRLSDTARFAAKKQEIDLMTGPTANENRDAGKDYATLTEEYKEYASFCFLPASYISGIANLTYPTVQLRVEYDIYDRSGNLVRPNQTATNGFPLTIFKRDDSGLLTPGPGDHLLIKLKIKPSYIGQLIDDDAELSFDIINVTD